MFEHNAFGQILAMVLPDGVRNELTYGAAGEEASRLVQETRDVGGLGVRFGRRRDAHGFPAEILDGNGGVTRLVHNALGQLEQLERPAVGGATADERYRYDADGRLISVERPMGDYAGPMTHPPTTHIVDAIERDVLGFATRTVLASNTAEAREVRFCNDYRGKAVRTTAPDGSIIRTRYDERALPLSEEIEGVDGLRIRSSRAYDRAGKLIRETDVHGSETTFEYDGFSRLVTITLPNGSRRRYKWGPKNQVMTEEVVGDDGTGVDRPLARVRHAYDEKSRRISTTHEVFTDNPAVSTDVTTQFFYDELDRVKKIVDRRGSETERQYDGLGRIVREVDPMGHEERSVYDGNGNVVERTSIHLEPGGGTATVTRTYTYDARSRRTAATEPDGAATTVYDDRDLLVEEADALGVATRRSYDAFHTMILQVQDAGGLNITQRWVIDQMSRTTAYVDPTGETTTYDFDSVGRLIRLQQPNGPPTSRHR